MLKRWLILCWLALPSFGDSPLTSTDFWQVYTDVPQVVSAQQLGRLDESLCSYLLGPATIDRKAAVINALGWSLEGKQNAQIFREALVKKYASPDLEPRWSAEEAFCLGYLMALDDYRNSQPALPYLRKALQAKPRSYTIAIVEALVQAQNTSDFAEGGRIVARLQQDKRLNRDLRGGAREAILEYMRPAQP